MVKLARVLKVEVGGPGDFAKLGKQAILEKLEEKGGPEARRRRPAPPAAKYRRRPSTA